MKSTGVMFLLIIVGGCRTVQANSQGVSAWEMNARLGRGVNLGNALEAPEEGQWGVTLREEYFQIIRDGGFDAVRIPIKWSAHSSSTAPYLIDPAFFDRVDWAVGSALSKGLVAVINIHHFDELMDNPGRYEQERFIALWRQIAEHYKNYADELLFELLNEPHGNLTDAIWHGLLSEAIRTVRLTNPHRNIVVGATGWNGKWELVNKLELPPDDRHIIATFHHYSPFQFTHQGAEWVDGSDAWLGTTWQAAPEQVKDITDEFDDIHAWSVANDRPVYMGEFGAYSRADMDSRILWTSTSARQAEARGFAWAYWEFCAGFGAYDDETGKWNELHRALVPDAPAENLIRNGEFDFGTDHWRIATREECIATIVDVEGAGLSGTNSLKVIIDDCPLTEHDSILVTQSDVRLARDKSYRISFVAQADRDRTIRTRLHRRGNERFVYWQREQSLTASPKTFAYLFDCTVTDSDVDIDFLVGSGSADVYIDKVTMREAWACGQVIETGRRLPADLTGPDQVPDCYVDAYDFSELAENWLRSDPLVEAAGLDVVPDGVIDFQDLLAVAEEWLTCNNPQDLACDSSQ